MKKLILALVIGASCACAQAPLETISDTWYAPLNGTITATWPTFSSAGVTRTTASQTAQMINGKFTIPLWPSDIAVLSPGSSPSVGFTYSITVTSGSYTITDQWLVPTVATGTVLSLKQVHSIAGSGTGSGTGNVNNSGGSLAGNLYCYSDTTGLNSTDCGIKGATLLTQAQYQSASPLNCQGGVSDTGTVMTCILPVALPGYVTNAPFPFVPHLANTGSTTLSVSSLGALTIKKGSACTTNLAGGDLQPGVTHLLSYNGTNLCDTSLIVTAGGGSLTVVKGTGTSINATTETAISSLSMPAMTSTSVCHIEATFLKSGTANNWNVYIRLPANSLPGSSPVMTTTQTRTTVDFWLTNSATSVQTWGGIWYVNSASYNLFDSQNTNANETATTENLSSAWVLQFTAFSATSTADTLTGLTPVATCF